MQDIEMSIREYHKLYKIAKGCKDFNKLIEIYQKEKSEGLISDYYLRVQDLENPEDDILLTPTGQISSKTDRRLYHYGFVVNDFLVTTKLKFDIDNNITLCDVLEDDVDKKYYIDNKKAQALIKEYKSSYCKEDVS